LTHTCYFTKSKEGKQMRLQTDFYIMCST